MRRWEWIEEREVLALHDTILALHGGAEGLRDKNLLRSALARPQQPAAYEPDTIELAAAYTAAILQNHPFVDGNKRIGFVVGALFLELNGYQLRASEEAATQAMMELAAGTLDVRGYTAFLRENAVRSGTKRK